MKWKLRAHVWESGGQKESSVPSISLGSIWVGSVPSLMGRLGVSCVNIKITLTLLLRVHYIATRWQSTHSKSAYCKCQSYNHSIILHYTIKYIIYIYYISPINIRTDVKIVQLILWSNPVTCKDNCIPLCSCLTNNPPRNFPLALKCAGGAKRPKSQPSGWMIWRFEVSGSGEGTQDTCFLIKYTPSLY